MNKPEGTEKRPEWTLRQLHQHYSNPNNNSLLCQNGDEIVIVSDATDSGVKIKEAE